MAHHIMGANSDFAIGRLRPSFSPFIDTMRYSSGGQACACTMSTLIAARSVRMSSDGAGTFPAASVGPHPLFSISRGWPHPMLHAWLEVPTTILSQIELPA